MKKIMIIALILMSSIMFAQRKGMGKGNGKGMGMGPNSMQNLTPEERFQKRTERKYTRIKKQLDKKDADKLITILKKYDKKIFTLMKPHMEKAQKLRKSEYANNKAKIALLEEGLDLRIKVLKIKKQEFKELKNSGLNDAIVVRILKKEMHHKMKGKRNGKGMRNHQGMQQGQRRGMKGQGW